MTGRDTLRKQARRFLVLYFWGALIISHAPVVNAQVDQEPIEASVIQRKLEWVISDMSRLIEEMRRISRREDRSHLVEDVEDILYRDVEFPLVYQTQAEKVVEPESGEPAGVLPTGFVRKSESPLLAQMFAKAYALTGLARSYEGFPAAAQDYLNTAISYDPNVETLTVKIDAFEPPKPLQHWLSEARETVTEQPVRVTFHGKAVAQVAADKLFRENIRFESSRSDIDYIRAAASRDFAKGIRRRLVTDDPITRNRTGWFRLYLAPGEYRVVTGEGPEHVSRIRVGSSPDQNRFLLETAGDGVTIFSIPVLETYSPPGGTSADSPTPGTSKGEGGENIGGRNATE